MFGSLEKVDKIEIKVEERKQELMALAHTLSNIREGYCSTFHNYGKIKLPMRIIEKMTIATFMMIFE